MTGESPEEPLACVGSRGTLFPLQRSIAHARGVHHLVVRVLAFNAQGEFLVQRRAEWKESCPGYYTDSASGHVAFSLSLLFDLEAALKDEAARELTEEVGVTVLGGARAKIRSFSRPSYSPGAHETSHCFIAAVKGKVVASREVDAVRTGFVTRDTLDKMLSREDFVPVAKQYWLELLAEAREEEPMEHFFPPRGP